LILTGSQFLTIYRCEKNTDLCGVKYFDIDANLNAVEMIVG